MRLIGHLTTEATARRFGDYLYVQGIENRVEHEKESGWAIWVSDEDKIGLAAEMLTAFAQNPEDSKYRSGAKLAAEKKAEEERSREAYAKKVREPASVSRPLVAYGFGPLTIALILACVVVFFLTSFGTEFGPVRALFMSEYRSGLTEVRQGQVWRLITPIFVHMGVWHILFNLLWLRDLGGMIESRLGTGVLATLVLAIAVASNLGQYYMEGPRFGGMSGVVYGLLGYVWMRGKFDPVSGLFLHPTTVVIMLAWFFLCLVGVIPNVANTAHAVGLAIGVAWGYLASMRYS